MSSQTISSDQAFSIKPKVVNLTEQVVIEEVDFILSTCKPPYRQFFAASAQRQRLISYVLDRVNKVYLLIQQPQEVSRYYKSVVAQKPEIRKMLREGIQVMATQFSR